MGVDNGQEDEMDVRMTDIPPEECAQHEFPLPDCARDKGFQVVIKRSALNGVHEHGRLSHNVELCGVLVGRLCKDEGGPFLYIEGSVRGESTVNKPMQVTYTGETWTEIHKKIEAEYPGKQIVGWYHTHPGFGIFLSEMDTFIHENFFNLPWHVAYVHDPVAREDGLFVWEDGEIHDGEMHIEEDVPASEDADAQEEAAEDEPGDMKDTDEPCDRLGRLEKKLLVLWFCLIAVALFALIWPFVVVLLSRSGSSPDEVKGVSRDVEGDGSVKKQEKAKQAKEKGTEREPKALR